MTWLKRIYIFLGSIQFAITLIAVVALVVISGTFIESWTDSHRFAALFTYGNPLFSFLIWCLFVNILVSALRRWPFKVKHIPFLLTHFGLLMILSGVLVKNYFGTQGSMSIMEGSSSSHLLLADTYVVQVEDKKNALQYYDLKNNTLIPQKNSNSESDLNLEVQLTALYPNSQERLESWIKGNKGYISGLAPFPIATTASPEMPLCCRTRFHGPETQPWNIYAANSNDLATSAKDAYIQGCSVKITDTLTNQTIYQGSLKKAIENNWAEISMPFSAISGLTNPYLKIKNQNKIDLSGPKALWNQNLLPPHVGKPSFTVDLSREPALVFLRDEHEDIFILALDPFGRIEQQPFRSDNLNSVISYNDGFAGYAVQFQIPFPKEDRSREKMEQSSLTRLQDILNASSNAVLSPPLELMRTILNQDFTEKTLAFLQKWEESGTWLASESALQLAKPINWNSIPASHLKGCQWIAQIIPEIEAKLKKGSDFFEILQIKGWPLLEALKSSRNQNGPCTPEELQSLLTLLSQQIFSISEHLPDGPAMNDALLLSAYMRVYGIHLDALRSIEDPVFEPIEIESPLTLHHKKVPALQKLEDNTPLIILEFMQHSQKEKIALSYDRNAAGLKWPVLKGQYLVRFQPKFQEIPYKVRLRDARQINYANSSQPYSFESDLLVTDLRTGIVTEKTISMNNVYETWDGYRFYLSNIAPGIETSTQRIQLVVNHDPGKYFITYPGALILTLGILLLFWMRPYSKSK